MKIQFEQKCFFNKRLGVWLLLSCFVVVCSCKKDWLDAKPQKALVVPSTIADFQALLDNVSSASGAQFNVDQPISDEIGAGDFYVSESSWTSITSNITRNVYTWAPDIYQGEVGIGEWIFPYRRVFYTNIALEGIEKIIPNGSNELNNWKNVKGAALYFRAYSHFNISQLYCKPYDLNTAANDLGIPIRLSSDFNIRTQRPSVQETYDQIISDIKQAATLLPVKTPISTLYKLRPNVSAAYGLLARVYLSMGKYDSANSYAEKCLQLYDILLDYNNSSSPPSNSSIAPLANIPFARFNNEVIFHMRAFSNVIFNPNRLIVDSSLFRLYDTSDIRYTCFFRAMGNDKTFKGNYDASATLFTGITTAEIFLIRAECKARLGNVSGALDDLNILLQKRWKSSAFIPVTGSNAEEALDKILIERKRELCFRGLRWSDLRRLNKESQRAIVLYRKINGQEYSLPPNDIKYVLPIPTDVIQLSGIEQNPRN